jgi:hypothetical protein
VGGAGQAPGAPREAEANAPEVVILSHNTMQQDEITKFMNKEILYSEWVGAM